MEIKAKDKCAICGKAMKILNISHIRAKHGIDNWDDYRKRVSQSLSKDSYGEGLSPSLSKDVMYIKGVKIEDRIMDVDNIWDMIDRESHRFRTLSSMVKRNIRKVDDRDCIDMRKGPYCQGCGYRMDLTHYVYILLVDNKEKLTGRPSHMKKPYHMECAIAVSVVKGHNVGVVHFPRIK